MNFNDLKSVAISQEELVFLQGGLVRYFIGKTEVTKEIYKDFAACHGVQSS